MRRNQLSDQTDPADTQLQKQTRQLLQQAGDRKSDGKIQRICRRIGKNVPGLDADSECDHEPVFLTDIPDKIKGEGSKQQKVRNAVVGKAAEHRFKKQGDLSGKIKVPGVIFQLGVTVAAVGLSNSGIPHIGRQKVRHLSLIHI